MQQHYTKKASHNQWVIAWVISRSDECEARAGQFYYKQACFENCSDIASEAIKECVIDLEITLGIQLQKVQIRYL